MLNTKNNLIIFIYFFIICSIGILSFSDYGISTDEHDTRITGFVSLKYIFTIFFSNSVNKIDQIIKLPDINEWIDSVGIIFNLPMALLEFIFKVEDSRNYYLFRHLANFLIFFISVYFFFLLILRRFNSIFLALLGSTFFIASPRIFAHSFYNNKDIVFMSLFIIGLFSAINFLEKPNYKNSMIFSLIVSLAIDVRIMGIFLPMLFSVLILINILREKKYKKIALKPFFTFLLLTPLFIILFWPYLWDNPINNFIYMYKHLKNIDVDIYNFYFGQYINSETLPWHYPLVWIIITTPIFYTILFLIGSAFILRRFIKRLFKIEKNDSYKDLWRGKNELKDLIFLSSFIIPLVAVINFNSSLFDGWRHLYFIYPSFLMISLFGLNLIKILLFKKKENLFVISIIIIILPTIIWMYNNHPHQYVYFNNLAGKNFNKKFEMDYWGLSNVNALNYIANNTNKNVLVSSLGTSNLPISKTFLIKEYRNKITITHDVKNADFLINNYRDFSSKPANEKFIVPSNFNVIHELKVDDITINTIYKKK